MNDPRPRMTSARPFEMASSVREALVDAHGVVAREHGHRGAEMDVLRPGSCGGEDDFGARDREVLAVVLPHSEERQADLVGEHRLIDDVADGLRIGQQRAVGGARDVSEGVESELEGTGVHEVSLHSDE